MDEWRKTTLEALTHLVTDKISIGKDPELPYVGLEQVPTGGGAVDYLVPSLTSTSTNGVFRAGDTLFGKLRPNLRKAVQVDFDGYCSTDLLVLRPGEGLCPNFVGHAIRTEPVLRHAEQHSIGTGMPRTSWGSLKKAPVGLPPLAEQRRIAEVLDTVDDAIRTTERLVAKHRRVRDAAEWDLLRPLARGPQIPVGACCDVTVGIVVRPTQYYEEGGEVPILRSANVREGGLDLSDLMYMSKESHQANPKTAVSPGDVLTVRTGYPGTTAVVGPEVPKANCVDVLVTRPGPMVNPAFVARWVNSFFGKGQVLRRQGGLAQQHFNVGDMKQLTIPDIPPAEQSALTDHLEAPDVVIQSLEMLASKLQQLQVGLQGDLLSGRVQTVAG